MLMIGPERHCGTIGGIWNGRQEMVPSKSKLRAMQKCWVKAENLRRVHRAWCPPLLQDSGASEHKPGAQLGFPQGLCLGKDLVRV